MFAILESIRDCTLGLLRDKNFVICCFLKNRGKDSLHKCREHFLFCSSMVVVRDCEKLGHEHQRIFTDARP